MRRIATDNGIRVKAYAGTTGILLAFNFVHGTGPDPDNKRPVNHDPPPSDFLGFALKRLRPSGEWEWLNGMKPFPGQAHAPGQPIASNLAPIQAFRWSDYTCYPDTQYTFEVYAFHGSGAKPWLSPELRKGPQVTITTQGIKNTKNVILFPRAVAASQAFSRKFRALADAIDAAPTSKAKTQVDFPQEAYDWLSRGVKEFMVGFIQRAADATWAIDIAIYEYEQEDLLAAIRAVQDAGAKLRVLYHYKSDKEKRSVENKQNIRPIYAPNKRGRKPMAIFHHKFVVLSRIVGGRKIPQAVMMGSTNFTDNAVYRQANVMHAVEDGRIAANYLALFDQIWDEPDKPAATKKWIDQNDPMTIGQGFFTGFSPRTGAVDLDTFAGLIKAAQQDVFFATAFNLDARIKEALLGADHDQILRYGVEDTASNELTGYNADRTANFVATAQIGKGLDAWTHAWLEESARQGFPQQAKRIHAKIVVIDFTSDAPTILSGSHNLSANASGKNDENYFVIQGDTDVADAYGVEVLRFFDHYRARYWMNKLATEKKAGKALAPLLLAVDSAWAKQYFKEGAVKYLDRVRFCS